MTIPASGQVIEQVPRKGEFAEALKKHLESAEPNRILFVVGRHTTEQEIGQWASGFQYTRFTGFSPNPKMEEVDAGVEIFRDNNCDILVAVGGGSAIDVAKAIKWKLVCDTEDGVNTENEVPKLIAAPTTAGTGSESTPFAVVYVDGVKNSLDEHFLLPDVALLCGELIMSVPAYHRDAAFMDALCQAMEAVWSKASTAESESLAVGAIEELLTHGCWYVQSLTSEKSLENTPNLDSETQLAAAQGTLQGANRAGRAIAITRTTAPHAMSYGLTSEFGMAHGHAVALCWVPVCETHVQRAYGSSDYLGLRHALEVISAAFDIDEPQDLPSVVAGIINTLGFERPGITESTAQRLATCVNVQRLSNNPVGFTSQEISDLYLQVSVKNPGLSEEAESPERRHKSLSKKQRSLGRWALTHKVGWKEAGRIQEQAMEILLDIDSACRKLGIEYFLFEGALLGAVRHQGPIPWDDDIDIAFLRKDYDLFVKNAPEILGEKYVVDTYETNVKHWTISGKVIKKSQEEFMHLRVEGLALANGVFVDLFALDNEPRAGSKLAILRGRYISGLRSLLFHRSGYQMTPSKRKGFLKKTLSRFTTVSWLHKRIDRAVRRFENKDTDYVANFGSLYKIEKETFRASDLVPTKTLKYGPLQVRVPANADRVLRQVYGDYEVMPPYWKRTSKHSFVARQDYGRRLAMLKAKQPWYWN